MEDKFLEKQEEILSPHVFAVSATMVGVCLTVIGIISIISIYHKAATIADDLTAVNALVFLLACAASYLSMRAKERQRRYSLERAADYLFLTGLFMVAFICVFIVVTIGQMGGK